MRKCHVEQRIQPLQPASILGKYDQEMYELKLCYFSLDSSILQVMRVAKQNLSDGEILSSVIR